MEIKELKIKMKAPSQPLPELSVFRWNLIKALIKRWHLTTLDWKEDDFGDIIQIIANRIGEPLLGGVREWIRFIRTMDVTNQWLFRDCEEFAFLKDHDAIMLLVQGENDYYWVVRRSDLHLVDPPVHGYLQDFEKEGRVFFWDKKVSDSVSAFALKYILDYHYMFKSLGGYSSTVPSHEEALRLLRIDFPNEIRIEDYYLFELPGIIAILNEFQLNVEYHIDPIQLPKSLKEYSMMKFSYSGKQV